MHSHPLLSPFTRCLCLVISSSALFLVSPKRIMSCVFSYAHGGWPFELGKAIQIIEQWLHQFHPLHMYQGSQHLPILHELSLSLHRHQSTNQSNLYTIHPTYFGLPCPRVPLSFAIDTLLAIRYSSIFSSIETISTLSDPLPANYLLFQLICEFIIINNLHS